MSEYRYEMGSRAGKEGRAEAGEQGPTKVFVHKQFGGGLGSVHPRSTGSRGKLFPVMLLLLYLTLIFQII